MDKTRSEELNENNLEKQNSPDLSERPINSLDGLNVDTLKYSTMCGSDIKIKSTTHDSEGTNKELENNAIERNNNNHHVVPIGVLIVLFTIYLGMNSIQKCFVNCSENEMLKESSPGRTIIYAGHNLRDSPILERLLEYKDICKDLEVFTKDINNTHDDGDVEGEEEENLLIPLETEISSGSGSGEDCAKSYSKKKKKSKYSIKLPTNGKHGFHKNNKSHINKAKYTHNDKKEIHLNKKNSTAEPIIYLFALVFVYLLLKAASDINQHYKSQTKNDKRLRRCSLQSYAQTHRPDRRSSKELALKQKQQRLMALSRSISIEQQQMQHQYHHHLEVSSPQRTPPTPPTQPSPSIRTTTSSNWQLLRQHMSVDNSDISASPLLSKPEFFSTMNRRCSVPVALNYQRQAHKNPSISLGIKTDPLAHRRTSITTPSDAIDPLAMETKRRVRMINRH